MIDLFDSSQVDRSNIITVSPSQLSCWMDCPQKHAFAYGEKIERADKIRSSKMDKGTTFHDYMHIYYQVVAEGMEPGSPEIRDFMFDRIREDFDPSNSEGFQILSEVTKMMSRYIQLQSRTIDTGQAVRAIEYEVLVPTGVLTPEGKEVYAHGFVDLITEYNGYLRIRDHKTGERPSLHSQAKTKVHHQLLTYASWLALDHPVAGIEISFIHSKPTKSTKLSDEFALYRYTPDRDVFVNFREHFKELVWKMFHTKPHKNYREACTSCDYYMLCTASMQGNPTSSIKKAEYVTRSKPTQFPIIISDQETEA